MEQQKSLSSLLKGYIGEELINTAIIASGGGTTAEVYMLGVKEGWIRGLDMKLLISTVKGAGCLGRAKNCGVRTVTINRKSFGKNQDAFNDEIAITLDALEIELVFLAGCNQFIRACPGIYFANNHPAPKETDGGRGMHDIMLHEHVLMRIKDKISRYPHMISEVHRTCIDHHEAMPRDISKQGMDIGDPLTTAWVDIPPYIISGFVEGKFDLRSAAELLQKHVMRYEYASIISSATMDGMRVRDAKKYGIKIGGF